MRVALAQLNSTVGDIDSNIKKILSASEKASKDRVSLLVTPELSLTGYPPEDLLLSIDFLKTVEDIQQNNRDPAFAPTVKARGNGSSSSFVVGKNVYDESPASTFQTQETFRKERRGAPPSSSSAIRPFSFILCVQV